MSRNVIEGRAVSIEEGPDLVGRGLPVPVGRGAGKAFGRTAGGASFGKCKQLRCWSVYQGKVMGCAHWAMENPCLAKALPV